MSAFSLSPDGKLAIAASETSCKKDFDYLVGNWNIRNRTLKEHLAGSDEWDEFDATQEFRLILLGLGNSTFFIRSLAESHSKASRCDCSTRRRVCGRSIGPTAK